MNNPTLSSIRTAKKSSRGVLYLLIVVSMLIIFVAIAFFSLRIDDELNPNVQALLQKAEVSADTTSEAYFYLMGIYASAEDDPEVVGQDIYDSVQQAIKAPLPDSGYLDYQNYPDSLKLALPEGELFCQSWEGSCLDAMFQTETDVIAELWVDHSVLMQRYAYFNNLDDYVTLVKDSLEQAPLPAYQYMIKANRLIELKSIDLARQGNDELSIQLLLDNIVLLRKQLLLQDNLIGRLTFLVNISSNLDVLSMITQNNDTQFIVNIASLTAQEKDFEMIMATEAAAAYEFFKLVADGQISEEEVPKSLAKIGFKLNMTMNAVFPRYEHVINNSRLSAVDYAVFREEITDIDRSLVRNPIGSILAPTATPNYNSYISRFFDVDTKIALFNATINNKDHSGLLATLSSPYYEKGHYAFFSDDKRSLCFDGPLPDERQNRCLRIK